MATHFRPVRIALLCLLPIAALIAQTPVYLDPAAPVDQRVDDLIGRMTLDEKIGQMMQVDHPAVLYNLSDVTKYFIGSILSGGGSDIGDNTTSTWAALHDTMQAYALKTRLTIPMIYGIDAVHGNNNIYGATIFPHNIGLGCTRDTDLVQEAERITAEELAATGIEWTFAPCIAVPRDERWGRTYEGFGETPELAQLMATAAVRGFQGDSLTGPTSILACAKHYLGDGGTTKGTNAGNTVGDEATIRRIHLPGYIAAIRAGAGSIMASFSSINGQPMTGNAYWLTDVLKKELGFKGFVVSDWGAVDLLGSNYTLDVATAINAGIDMVMLPYRYADFQTAMRYLVGNGTITLSRVDDAVRRILTVKFSMGLFERPYADKNLNAHVGSAEHRAVARKCVRKSLVLMKNSNRILPLPKSNRRILVAGSHADDIGNQCGGWTISWQGKSGNITPGTTILQGMRNAAPADQIEFSLTGNFADTKADYSVVVVGELPYAEGNGNRTDLTLASADISLIAKMKSYGNPVVVILVSGRPLIIGGILSFSDAIIAAWLPGTEGDGVADVLFGDYSPQGVLSHSWPRSMTQVPINVGDNSYDPLYPYGFGLTYTDTNATSVPTSPAVREVMDLGFNYPNPFNPTTNIEYQISKLGLVRLSVHDLLGHEVAVLVNEVKVPGIYLVRFDGSGLASGVYFYRLQVRPPDFPLSGFHPERDSRSGTAVGRDSKSGAGEFIQTRRLLLLK
jgi:beta-glucosidase